MSYCTNCGQELPAGARFCTSCGTPSASPDVNQASAAESATPGQPQPAAQPQPVQQPRPATVSAFASVPVSDYVRDGAAVFLLLMSMFMVWSASNTGPLEVIAATKIDVILITLVSMFSVTIPYLWRSGVFGVAWGYRQTQLARLAANVPYFVLVLVYLVLELVNRHGLGPAMAFGLAGAILAAQPRRAELGSAPADAVSDKRWAMAIPAFGVLVGIITLVQAIIRLTVAPGQVWASSLIFVVLGAANAALLIWTGIGAGRGQNVRRLIGIGIGAAGVGIGLLALLPSVTVASAKFSAYTPDVSVFFWMAFGALAASPSVARIASNGSTDEIAAALDRTRTITVLAIAASGLLLVVPALVLISNAANAGYYGMYFNPVVWVVTMFLAAVGIVGGFVTRAGLKQHTRQSYLLAAGYAGLLFVLGLVIVIMTAVSFMSSTGTLGLLVGFVFPVALGLSMFGKAWQRESFRSLGLGGHAHGFSFDSPAAAQPAAGATASNAPAATAVAGAAPAAMTGNGTAARTEATETAHIPVDDDRILAEAANPATAPARLSELAAQYPHARAAIAANPAAYPALLEWLAQRDESGAGSAPAQRG